MITAEAAVAELGKGFENIKLVHGSTYKDNSTVVIVPTRGMVHHRFVSALNGMIGFMNQKKMVLFVAGDEVGVAYTTQIMGLLAHPEFSKWKYVLTIEDDNLVPPDAHIRLVEAIEDGGWDAVSGLYFTKGELNMPMAYGSPERFKNTGELEFRPRDVRECLEAGKVMPVNGIAMGCALWRMDLFRQVPGPWFVTVNDVVDGVSKCFTQDLFFCEKAVRAGKRFAVDMRVRVGHLDVNTGVVY